MLKDRIDFVVALVGRFVFIEREEEKNSIILRHSACTYNWPCGFLQLAAFSFRNVCNSLRFID